MHQPFKYTDPIIYVGLHKYQFLHMDELLVGTFYIHAVYRQFILLFLYLPCVCMPMVYRSCATWEFMILIFHHRYI